MTAILTEKFNHNLTNYHGNDETAFTQRSQNHYMVEEDVYDNYLRKIDQGHFWKGILYPGFLFRADVLDDIKNIKIRPDDIFIATFPKSGTTWTAEIVSLIKSGVDLNYVRSKDISERVVHLETPPRWDIQSLEELKSPRIFGTHLPFNLLPDPIKNGDCKVIYVMRNPKDVAVSFFHHHRMAKDLGNFEGTFKEFLALFSAGKTVCGSWFDHVLGYWKNKHRNTLFLKYEEMKKDFRLNVNSISKFLGVPLNESQIHVVGHHCSFEVMKKNKRANRDWIPFFDNTKAHFMRKGVVGDWKNHFDSEDNDMFMKLYEEKIGQHSNLRLDFEIPPPQPPTSNSLKRFSSAAIDECRSAETKDIFEKLSSKCRLSRRQSIDVISNKSTDPRNQKDPIQPQKLSPTYELTPESPPSINPRVTNICSKSIIPSLNVQC